MFPNKLIRSLISALTGLIVLVCLSVLLLATSAFLYPNADASPTVHEERTNASELAPVKRVSLTAQQLQGKQLFVNNCAQCHAVTDQVVVGPGLRGVTTRTPGKEWLHNWIRNSSTVVASGDPYAVQLFNKFQKIQMSSFPNLTDADIDAILAYVAAGPTATP